MAIFIIAIACFLSYSSLKNVSLVVEDLSEENQRLSVAKNMLKAIDLAEAEIDNYVLTKRASKLDTIHTILTDLLNESDHLKLLCEDSPQQLSIVYGIDSIVNNNIEWYYNFISFKSRGASDDFFKALSQKLAKAYTTEGTKNKQQSLSVKKEENEETPGFFSRIFRKTKKQKKDTNSVVSTVGNTPPGYKINQIIKEARHSEQQNQKASILKELSLLKENKALKNSLYEQLNKFSINEINNSKQKAKASKMITNEAIIILAIVTILGILSFIFFLVLIMIDITRGNKLKKELIASRQEAMRLGRAKEDFLANMSHEIRTPLNSIIGFSEQLNQTTNLAEKNKYAAAIQKSSNYLLNIINDILDFSKINQGKISLEKIPFSIKEIVEDMVDVFTPHAAKKNLEFYYVLNDATSALHLEGDPHRLKQILMNLISNAIKFTEKGSVEVRIEHTRFSDENIELKIQVRDTGIGIRNDSLEKIFNSFDQADNSISRKFGGTGLGLAICKQLTTIQGGELSVISEPGRGSEFTLSIPYRLIEEGASDTSKEIKQEYDLNALKKVKLLIADDDEMSTILISTILGKYAIQPKLAGNGMEAFMLFQSDRFNMVLTDINMPEMGGVDLLQQIRKDTTGKNNTPVIAITANVNKHDIEKYLQCGFNGILLKPYSEDQLLKLIHQHLNTLKIIDAGPETIKNSDLKRESFDPEQLNRIGNGNEEFTVKMLEKFILATTEYTEAMMGSLASHEYEKLKNTAHKCIPSYSIMGLQVLVEYLKFIEINSGKDQNEVALAAAVKLVNEETKKVIQDIQEYLGALAVNK